MDTTKHRDLLHWKNMVLEATKKERGVKSGPASPGARRETATTSEKRTFSSFPRDFPSHHHTRICYLDGEKGLRQAVLIVLLSGRVSRTIILIYGQPLDPPQ
jgi:hypothetical protein